MLKNGEMIILICVTNKRTALKISCKINEHWSRDASLQALLNLFKAQKERANKKKQPVKRSWKTV